MGIDLVERAVAPTLIVAAGHQPVFWFRIGETSVGHRRVVCCKGRTGTPATNKVAKQAPARRPRYVDLIDVLCIEVSSWLMVPFGTRVVGHREHVSRCSQASSVLVSYEIVSEIASGSAAGGCAFRSPRMTFKAPVQTAAALPWRCFWRPTAAHRLRDFAEFGSLRIFAAGVCLPTYPA